jgi:cathepsin B
LAVCLFELQYQSQTLFLVETDNMWKLLVLFLVAAAHAGFYEELTAKQVPEIMKLKPTWVAGHNEALAGKTEAQLKQLLGGKVDASHKVPLKTYPQVEPASIPASFDARSQWPKCNLIPFIRDQGQCGSCWAVATTSVMSDRYCIQTNGAQQPYISDEDVLSCCSYCGSGCGGGYPYNALEWWTQYGVVTGGTYNSRQGCKPYEVPPTGYGYFNGQTPACYSSCESGYTTSYQSDKHSGSKYYQVGNGVTGMQQELMTNGPIATVFNVYQDFYNYQSGIYQYSYGAYDGGHVVRIIGWGEENNTPYWLVANSWNSTWGMGGFFKMIRGINNCGFESNVYAGEARV